MKIVNFFAGPGTGKSTIAAGLFYKMKMSGYSVELATEYAKDLTYEDRINILKNDQLYVLSKQHRRIHRLLTSTDYIISDSPILMTWIYYNKTNNIYNEKIFKDLVLDIHNYYDSINIYLERNDNLKYQNVGRIHTLKESKEIDLKILKLLEENNVDFYKIKVDGGNTVKEIYKKFIKEG